MFSCTCLPAVCRSFCPQNLVKVLAELIRLFYTQTDLYTESTTDMTRDATSGSGAKEDRKLQEKPLPQPCREQSSAFRRTTTTRRASQILRTSALPYAALYLQTVTT